MNQTVGYIDAGLYHYEGDNMYRDTVGFKWSFR